LPELTFGENFLKAALHSWLLDMKFFKNLSFFMISSIFASSLASENILKTKAGSTFIKGSLQATYDRLLAKDGKGKIAFTSDAGLGLFVADNWSITLGIPVEWVLTPKQDVSVGTAIATTFFLDSNHQFIPYFGIGATPSYLLKRFDNKFWLSANAHAGILLAISDSAALDLGFSPEIFIKLNEKQNWRLKIPAGMLGLRIFF